MKVCLLIPASRFFKQGAQTTAGFLVSQRLNKLPNFFSLPGRGYQGAENILSEIGKTARGEKGGGKTVVHGVETSALVASAQWAALG